MLSQLVISVPAVWKLAEQIGKIQKPNKSAEQISEVGRIRRPIWGGGLPTPSQTCQKVFGGNQIFEILHVPWKSDSWRANLCFSRARKVNPHEGNMSNWGD